MSEWKIADGKGVPQDAIPGVTMTRGEALAGYPFPGGGYTREAVWPGGYEWLWDWSKFGKIDGNVRRCARIIAYRNPSTQAAVEALKAIAADPKRKFRKLVKA